MTDRERIEQLERQVIQLTGIVNSLAGIIGEQAVTLSMIVTQLGGAVQPQNQRPKLVPIDGGKR